MTATIETFLNKFYAPPATKPAKPAAAIRRLAPGDDLPGEVASLFDRVFAGLSRQEIRHKATTLLGTFLSFHGAGVEALDPSGRRFRRASSCDCGGSCSACRAPLASPWATSKIPEGTPELSKPAIIVGYPVVFNERFDTGDGLGLQQFAPGSFSKDAVEAKHIDIRFAHNPADLLGDHAHGLTLAADGFGLLAAFEVSPGKPAQVAHLVRYGGFDSMSLGWCKDETHGRYLFGQQVGEFRSVRFGEVSIVEKGANGAACCLALCEGDEPAANPWEEQSLLRQEAGLERSMPSWAMAALTTYRRRRAMLRLQRLASYLSAARVFEPWAKRGEIIRACLSRM